MDGSRATDRSRWTSRHRGKPANVTSDILGAAQGVTPLTDTLLSGLSGVGVLSDGAGLVAFCFSAWDLERQGVPGRISTSAVTTSTPRWRGRWVWVPNGCGQATAGTHSATPPDSSSVSPATHPKQPSTEGRSATSAPARPCRDVTGDRLFDALSRAKPATPTLHGGDPAAGCVS